jgi:hypothetical protein
LGNSAEGHQGQIAQHNVPTARDEIDAQDAGPGERNGDWNAQEKTD